MKRYMLLLLVAACGCSQPSETTSTDTLPTNGVRQSPDESWKKFFTLDSHGVYHGEVPKNRIPPFGIGCSKKIITVKHGIPSSVLAKMPKSQRDFYEYVDRMAIKADNFRSTNALIEGQFKETFRKEQQAAFSKLLDTDFNGWIGWLHFSESGFDINFGSGCGVYRVPRALLSVLGDEAYGISDSNELLCMMCHDAALYDNKIDFTRFKNGDWVQIESRHSGRHRTNNNFHDPVTIVNLEAQAAGPWGPARPARRFVSISRFTSEYNIYVKSLKKVQ